MHLLIWCARSQHRRHSHEKLMSKACCVDRSLCSTRQSSCGAHVLRVRVPFFSLFLSSFVLPLRAMRAKCCPLRYARVSVVASMCGFQRVKAPQCARCASASDRSWARTGSRWVYNVVEHHVEHHGVLLLHVRDSLCHHLQFG